MKVSIIGAGNVGGTLAQRVLESGLADVVLLDIAEGLAKGKSLDLQDASSIISHDRKIKGTNNYDDIKNSDIVVVTAGLARTPGMTRADLLNKNANIIKDIILSVKEKSSDAIVIIVTNPLDILTNIAAKLSGFSSKKIFGMGGVLDSSRFANLISEKLNVPVTNIEALVIGEHSKNMIPVPELTKVSGKLLTEVASSDVCDELSLRTSNRGAEIVECLGKGSAYYAPSAAAFKMVKAILKDEKIVVPACAYCQGEYSVLDACIGVPVKLGKEGIEEIVELNLGQEKKEKLIACAKTVKEKAASFL